MDVKHGLSRSRNARTEQCLLDLIEPHLEFGCFQQPFSTPFYLSGIEIALLRGIINWREPVCNG